MERLKQQNLYYSADSKIEIEAKWNMKICNFIHSCFMLNKLNKYMATVLPIAFKKWENPE